MAKTYSLNDLPTGNVSAAVQVATDLSKQGGFTADRANVIAMILGEPELVAKYEAELTELGIKASELGPPPKPPARARS